MSATAKTHAGLDDILSVTSSVEAAAAAALADSSTATPQSPAPTAIAQMETSTSTKNLQNTCSTLNKSGVEGDESTAQYERALEPMSKEFVAISSAKSPSPSVKSSQSPLQSHCSSPRPPSASDKKENRPKNLFASARKSFRKTKVQKQYTIANMYPSPMFKSMDIDSPEGSFSSMGFVGSALGVNVPFASQSSFNAAAARRARMNRTKSVVSRNTGDYDGRSMYHSSGRLFRANSTRNSAMASYDNLQADCSGFVGGGSLHSPSAGLLRDGNLQQYGCVLGGSAGMAGLEIRQHHSVPGSTTNVLTETSPSSGAHSPRNLSKSPPRFRGARRLNRQVTLNPSCLSNSSNESNYQKRSPTSRLQSSLQAIPSQGEQDEFISVGIVSESSPLHQQHPHKSIMKQRSLPVQDEPSSSPKVFKDDQGFLRPNFVPCPPPVGYVGQASMDSHRSSISSSGNTSLPLCTSPGSPSSHSRPMRQIPSARSPRSPNMSRQISKLSDQISMIDEEAEDAIEAAAAVANDDAGKDITNGVTTNGGYDNHVLPTSQRITPSLRQLSYMRSTTNDNCKSLGTYGGGGYFNVSQSSRQGSFSRQSPGLKRQVTICEDSMSIPESGRVNFMFIKIRQSVLI